ncbi:MAG: elongation factor EF-2 [archaeon]
MAKKEEVVKQALKLMKNQANIRNIGIVAHLDHGKTTMTDSLVAASGLMSEALAGKQLVMDFEDQEQARGITINAANISITQKIGDQEYLINIIDTPGHVDFGGEVLRAMRAVDGVIVVVDAVEGVMPQTETVIRQALREYVKPVLFINKVDRMVNELQVTQEQMQERFVKVISQVNKLIRATAPKELVEQWTVKVQDGSVIFGSGYHKWAVSVVATKKTGISFKEVYDYCRAGKQKELSQKSPLFSAMLDMIIQHLPSPMTAQKYRAKVIWTGDPESPTGKAMVNCDPNGPFSMMVTDITVDPHAGDIATGRIYSGKIGKGTKLKIIKGDREINVQKVGIYMGPDFIDADEVPAGNIAAIVGAKEIYAGQTIASEEIVEFESFKTHIEPVITVSIEAKNTKDLPKLIEVIKQLTKEDPNLRASINSETGEHLLSGQGELHLEVNQYRITERHKVPIQVSPPIVVYHESISKKSQVFEAKTPNKHNKFKMFVEPINREILDNIIEKGIDAKIRPKDKEIVEKLIECGVDREDAKKTWIVFNQNMLVDSTRGIEALHEIKELVIQGFKDAMTEGPLAKEKCFGVMVRLTDATLHEDSIHRGPAQVLPAITRGIWGCMLSTTPVMFEPKQILSISVPENFMGAVSRELGSRRTQITEMRSEGDMSIIIGKAPVKELIGFSAAIRGATEGRALWTAEYFGYEQLPFELQKPTISEIRKRKGLESEPKHFSHFFE